MRSPTRGVQKARPPPVTRSRISPRKLYAGRARQRALFHRDDRRRPRVAEVQRSTAAAILQPSRPFWTRGSEARGTSIRFARQVSPCGGLISRARTWRRTRARRGFPSRTAGPNSSCGRTPRPGPRNCASCRQHFSSAFGRSWARTRWPGFASSAQRPPGGPRGRDGCQGPGPGTPTAERPSKALGA